MSVQNTKPSMVRYDNFIVKLYPLANKTNIFSYSDPFESTTTGIVYPITIERIIYSSDTAPTTLSGTIADMSIVKYNDMTGGAKEFLNSSSNSSSDSNAKDSNPKVGWGISVDAIGDGKHTSASATSKGYLETRIFKGYITSISRQIGQNGIFYRFEARDIKSRLTYQTIKKVYNGTYKNAGIPIIGEKRVLDATSELNNPYTSGNLTVKKILEDILAYAQKTSSNGTTTKKYSKFVGFELTDFVFQDNYLENFVPPTISFDNITILEAIYKLINTAGPYRIVVEYASRTNTNDKVYFSSLNNKCKNCGSKINLKYGETDSTKGFHQVNVVSDSTIRRIQDACNIMKSYTGQIEWYSGHFYIMKGKPATIIKSGIDSKSNSNSFGDGSATYTKNQLSCRNWDGYHYYFGLNSVPYGDSNSDSLVVVGTPLYPAWDPNSGYGPYQRSFVTFLDDPEKPVASLPANEGKVCLTLNSGVTENDMKFVKHRNFVDTVGRDRFKSSVGVSYVAYAPYDVCVACNGTGAVENDCSDGQYAHLFGNSRKMDGTKNGTWSFTPFNYNFGTATYESKGDKMEQYVGTGYLVPYRHPLPWKNTCPICRGTGIEPWFKMGTILNSLVDISPSQAKIGELTNNRVNSAGKDTNSGSLVIDKTYSQIAEDMSYKYPVAVHVETSTNYIAYAQDAESNSSSWFKHPLADTRQVAFHNSNTTETINLLAKIFPDGKDTSTRGEDKDSQYVQVLYYTQIQDATGYQIDTDRSMVIFNNTMFIPYRAPMATVTEVMSKNKVKLPAYDKDLKCFKYSQKGEMNGVGQNVGSFWRPSRAWITCYFKRDRFEHFFKKERVIKRKLKGAGATDFDEYTVAPRIEDNRYCAEIRKTSSENPNEVEEFKVRPVARGIFCDDIKWQVHPWDYEKIVVPSADDNQDFIVPTDYSDMWKSGGVYDSCVKKSYYFPCGKVLKFEKLREIEVRTLKNNNKDISELLKSDKMGKVITWAHKDERMKLFEKACAELERRNNVQISGTVTVRGEIPTFNGGFGWVELYDGMKACVVKVELSFGTNFLMNLEVGTEELRVGQKKEADKDYDRLIQDKISELNLNNRLTGANGPVDTLDASDNVTVMGALSVGGGVGV